jgi:acyl-coenzyme A synthetase/AMP-(fatty) acid ligase
MLQDARVRVARLMIRSQIPDPSVHLVRLDEDALRIGAESDESPQALANSLDVACGLYTSGSTGMPKCVALTRGGVDDLAREP